ncbi:MAG: hypothetical protein DWQ02_10020 [Bacteroidetes bacterium]|nr:MAG: hypothetical protein DWQ02_10020 [Bacteroidota bacterium]
MDSKKLLKRVFLILGIFFVVTLITMTILASILEDKIGAKIISEVNKQIDSELTVDAFELSVVRTFPNFGANLQGVLLKDSRDEVLLEAREVSFRLGILSLLSNNIAVKSVVISDGALNIEIDRKGRGNYDIFKTSQNEEPKKDGGSSPGIKLSQARLNDVELIYEDHQADQHVMFIVENASFSGRFSSDQFSLKSEADLKSHFIELDGGRFLNGKDVSYDADIFVDLKNEQYKFQDVELRVGTNVFKVKGDLENRGKNTTYYDLLLEGEDVSLASLAEMLPRQYLENLGNLKSRGNMEFRAAIKGESNKRKDPQIIAQLNLRNGKISSSRMDGALKDVSFSARFDNGKSHSSKTSTLEIRNFKAYFKRELFEVDFKMYNLDDPRITFNLDGTVPLKMVYGMMEDPRITNGSGEIEIEDLRLKGRYKDMLSVRRISKVELGGNIEFDDASLTINEEKMILDKGRISLNDNALSIEDLKLEGAGSEIHLKGFAYNIIPVLFADSLNSNRAELEFKMELTSPEMDLDRLAGLSLASEEEAAEVGVEVDSLAGERIKKREKTTSFLKGTFDATIDNFNYNKIEGSDFVGKLVFDNNELKIDGSTNAMDGHIVLDGKLFFEDEPWLKAKVDCRRIDLKEFFRQSDNFSQEVLTADNVSGTMDSKMLIKVYWDEAGNFLEDKMHVLVGMGLENGEIKNFEMLEGFSSLIKIDDLRHIKFTNMENFFEVRNSRLIIPVMFIQSNAMNLTVSGDHSFDNEIKYNLKVNAGQVLVNRLKKHDPGLSPQPAKRNGFFNLYYTILGTVDQFNYKTAKQKVKEDFRLSELHKRDIQHELEKEFGLIDMVEAPLDWKEMGNDEPVFAIPVSDTGKIKKKEEFLDFEVQGGGSDDDDFLDFEVQGGGGNGK